MKNFGICMLLLLLLVGGIGGYFVFKNIRENKRIAAIKEGWYVEITYDQPINVREEPNAKSNSLGTVSKGEVYKVLDVDIKSGVYNWYKIEYEKEVGWIASGKKKHWVNDVNNPNDIAVPEVKFHDPVYKVATIKDINYKHLEVVEDTDKYKITHVVYHEVDPIKEIDQYWIYYTITDGAGKSSSKMQKIEFEVTPEESQVKDFADFRR